MSDFFFGYMLDAVSRWRRIKDENEHSKVMNLDNLALKVDNVERRRHDATMKDIIKFVARSKTTTKKQKSQFVCCSEKIKKSDYQIITRIYAHRGSFLPTFLCTHLLTSSLYQRNINKACNNTSIVIIFIYKKTHFPYHFLLNFHDASP